MTTWQEAATEVDDIELRFLQVDAVFRSEPGDRALHARAELETLRRRLRYLKETVSRGLECGGDDGQC